MRGTVEGLAPDQAVAAVLATTSLRPDVEDEQITIDIGGALNRGHPQ